MCISVRQNGRICICDRMCEKVLQCMGWASMYFDIHPQAIWFIFTEMWNVNERIDHIDNERIEIQQYQRIPLATYPKHNTTRTTSDKFHIYIIIENYLITSISFATLVIVQCSGLETLEFVLEGKTKLDIAICVLNAYTYASISNFTPKTIFIQNL